MLGFGTGPRPGGWKTLAYIILPFYTEEQPSFDNSSDITVYIALMKVLNCIFLWHQFSVFDDRTRVYRRRRRLKRGAVGGAVNWCRPHAWDCSLAGRRIGGEKTSRPSPPSPPLSPSRCASPDGARGSEATEGSSHWRTPVRFSTKLAVGNQPWRASVCRVIHAQVSSWLQSTAAARVAAAAAAAAVGKAAWYFEHSER